MDEGSSEQLASLAPMRVRQDSIQSNVADFLARQRPGRSPRYIEIDGTVAGVDVSAHLGGPTEVHDDTETQYNEALERFMRNEIPYDEFMQLTGGVELDDEAADFDETADEADEAYLAVGPSRSPQKRKASLSNNEAGEDDGAGSQDDEPGPSTSMKMLQLGSVPIGDTAARIGFSRSTLMGDDIDEDRLLGIPVELRNSNRDEVPGSSSKEGVMRPSFKEIRRNRLNKTLDALLGQANVSYAKGQTREALTMLLEVIRQEPRNGEPYRQVADIYHEMNQQLKSLQYGLLAAHLNPHTPSEQWSELGDLARQLDRPEEAAACYGRAMRLEPTVWRHYEKRITMLDSIGLRPLAMKTRLLAAQNIDQTSANVDFDWFQSLIKTVAEYYIQLNDEERAISALEAFVVRSREFGRKADTQHNILVGMWIAKKRFVDAAKSIFALCPGITALDEAGNFAFEIKFNNAGYTVEPFPPEKVNRFVVGEGLSTFLLAKLIVCFIRLGRKDLVPTLVDKLFEREILTNDDGSYLDIARSYEAMGSIPHAQKYIEHLLAREPFCHTGETHFLYGKYLGMRKKFEEAAKSYQKALELMPSHVDARINLSTIQQRLGMPEQAFETLRDYDLDAGTSLPDERLLIRQADFLFDRKRIDQFVRCVRMLLAPHFFAIYQNSSTLKKRNPAIAKEGVALCAGMRNMAFSAVRLTSFEKFVKRLGAIAVAEDRTSDLNALQLHDYCFKLLEILINQNRYTDALHVCCYSYLQPAICSNRKTLETFQHLTLFCSMKAQHWPLAFEYLRWFHTASLNNHFLLTPAMRDLLFTRIFNAMNFVFCHSQNVSYHRYVMRALARIPGNAALQMISGNNSLITGAYRHALGEYLRVWFQVPDNPLICLLIALTFVHMACKKDISSRHMVVMRGLAFMNRYQKLRGACQETFYNIGRMFHQINVLPLAMHFYEECLKLDAPFVVSVDEGTGEEKLESAERYDLRPLAAHNLASIYESSGNVHMARFYYEKYCVIE